MPWTYTIQEERFPALPDLQVINTITFFIINADHIQSPYKPFSLKILHYCKEDFNLNLHGFYKIFYYYITFIFIQNFKKHCSHSEEELLWLRPKIKIFLNFNSKRSWIGNIC